MVTPPENIKQGLPIETITRNLARVVERHKEKYVRDHENRRDANNVAQPAMRRCRDRFVQRGQGENQDRIALNKSAVTEATAKSPVVPARDQVRLQHHEDQGRQEQVPRIPPQEEETGQHERRDRTPEEDAGPKAEQHIHDPRRGEMREYELWIHCFVRIRDPRGKGVFPDHGLGKQYKGRAHRNDQDVPPTPEQVQRTIPKVLHAGDAALLELHEH